MKEGKTGKILHAQSFDLTVLLEPSPPTIRPANPTATEGRPFNLTCSSVGGSPPPQIKWYKLGKSTTSISIILRDKGIYLCLSGFTITISKLAHSFYVVLPIYNNKKEINSSKNSNDA